MLDLQELKQLGPTTTGVGTNHSGQFDKMPADSRLTALFFRIDATTAADDATASPRATPGGLKSTFLLYHAIQALNLNDFAGRPVVDNLTGLEIADIAWADFGLNDPHLLARVPDAAASAVRRAWLGLWFAPPWLARPRDTAPNSALFRDAQWTAATRAAAALSGTPTTLGGYASITTLEITPFASLEKGGRAIVPMRRWFRRTMAGGRVRFRQPGAYHWLFSAGNDGASVPGTYGTLPTNLTVERDGRVEVTAIGLNDLTRLRLGRHAEGATYTPDETGETTYGAVDHPGDPTVGVGSVIVDTAAEAVGRRATAKRDHADRRTRCYMAPPARRGVWLSSLPVSEDVVVTHVDGNGDYVFYGSRFDGVGQVAEQVDLIAGKDAPSSILRPATFSKTLPNAPHPLLPVSIKRTPAPLPLADAK